MPCKQGTHSQDRSGGKTYLKKETGKGGPKWEENSIGPWGAEGRWRRIVLRWGEEGSLGGRKVSLYLELPPS